MTRSTLIATLVILLLAACTGTAATDPGASPDHPASAGENRQAVFTEIENNIRGRDAGETNFRPANLGDQLSTGGQAQSGDDSRARLDLNPEGTIIRIGPNTLFTVVDMNNDSKNPFTRLYLSLGQMWVVLSGGSLEVETPNGTGAVRGSYMGVNFDPVQGAVVTCLEGHCSLGNRLGTTELTNGQAASLLDANQPPSLPRPLTEAEILGWLQNSPEGRSLIDPETKTPEGLPSLLPDNPTLEKTPSGKASTYTLINNCDRTWHWRFIGPQIVNIDVPAGQTLTGTLPPGTYTALDWWRIGETHQTGSIPPGGNIVVRGCPDK